MSVSRRRLIAAVTGALSAIGLTGSASAGETETGWGEGSWGAGPWGGTTSQDCFIATAAYGSADHDRVLELREFRDRVLARRALGRLFIRTYYRISPPIARWIGRSERRKRLTRRYLIRPVTRLTTNV
ncbi:hypothetical protein GS429_02740 [Natronorubrum sp. JWXQ-INN-674]|uniref:Uncharacterized protein n=1 Tax=Natronorubrum halalkaliphilum TaxID=2691917 RepID=A0A6B0VJK7_9EURY|nr:CFI-box-CTERM domain-containing protein [Natronorubrum halalkaliphilum]MXV60992.1 hypothetical protein [Natronorubrum halalkaliphilum]